jgi:hypothetical protein
VSGPTLEQCFREFRWSAARLETLPSYSVLAEAERIAAWRKGHPRPERSVRTSEYLRDVAANVLSGRERARVRVVNHPLTEYARYQLAGYIESAAAGEEIRIAVRADAPDALSSLGPDFWLFDRATPHARAVIMQYDGDGRFTGSVAATDAQVSACTAAWGVSREHSVSLNEYLASIRQSPVTP